MTLTQEKKQLSVNVALDLLISFCVMSSYGERLISFVMLAGEATSLFRGFMRSIISDIDLEIFAERTSERSSVTVRFSRISSISSLISLSGFCNLESIAFPFAVMFFLSAVTSSFISPSSCRKIAAEITLPSLTLRSFSALAITQPTKWNSKIELSSYLTGQTLL